MKERYYSESLLRSLAYDDDVNGNCDGMIDFTVIDSISGADVEPVRHGEWIAKIHNDGLGNYTLYHCSECDCKNAYKRNYCGDCGVRMDGGSK